MLELCVKHALPGFSLDLDVQAPPGVTALFGHSGAGKSTVVRAVTGLLRPDTGRIVVDGTVLCDTTQGAFLPPHKRRIGAVFQDGRLFPHLTVLQNLTYGQRFLAGTKPELEPVVELLGLKALLPRRPAGLSGGEMQRVALGRALLSAPRMLVMDEPLAALDQSRKDGILPFLDKVCRDSGVPILYVSHAPAEIARLATTVVVLEKGRLRRAGPVSDIMADPELAPALGLREAGAVLTARVMEHASDGLSALRVSGGVLWLPRVALAVGASLRVRVAARDVILADHPPKGLSALNVLASTVVTLHSGTGPGMMVQLAAGEDKLLARVTRRSAQTMGLRPGKTVYAVIKTVSVARADVGGGEP